MLGLRCYALVFSHCGKRGHSVALCRLLAGASLTVEHSLGSRTLVVAVHGLSSFGSESLEHRAQ